MPQVPSPEYPSVEPTGGSPTPYQRINVSPDSFGAAVGSAVQQLGGTMDRVGGMLEKHALQFQSDLNEAAVNEQSTKSLAEMAERMGQFKMLQGKDAIEAQPQLTKDLEEIRVRGRSALPSPLAQKLYDQQTLRQFGYGVKEGALYSAGEAKRYASAAAKGASALASQRAAQDPYSDENFSLQREAKIRAIETDNEYKGAAPEVLESAKNQGVSELWHNRLGAIATTDAFRAEKLFEANRKEMTAETQLSLQKTIGQEIIRQGTHQDAEAIVGGNSIDGYLRAIRGAESGGNDAAKASGSSALGRYQVTNGTWKDMMKSHPELGLTADGRTDPAQQEKFIRVFTADNADFLRKNNVPITGQNLYLAHFLGRQGAVDFYKGLQEDPNAAGVNYAGSDAASANPSIFYKNGTPRTALEIYQLLGKKVGDSAGPLTPNSGPGQLAAMEQAAKDRAATRPDIPEHLRGQYADTLVSRVKTQYNAVKAVAKDAMAESYQIVAESAAGPDPQDASKAPKTLEELSPQARDIYNNHLDDRHRQRILNQLNANATADYPMTDETSRRYYELHGQATSDDPAVRDAFNKSDVWSEHLPRAQRSQLAKLQRDNKEVMSSDDVHLNNMMSAVRPSLPPELRRPDSKQAQEFRGRFAEQLRMFQQNSGGRRPNEDEAQKLAAGLIRQVVTGTSVFGLIEHKDKLFRAPPPQERLDQLKAQFQEVRPGVPLPPDSFFADIWRKEEILKNAKKGER